LVIPGAGVDFPIVLFPFRIFSKVSAPLAAVSTLGFLFVVPVRPFPGSSLSNTPAPFTPFLIPSTTPLIFEVLSLRSLSCLIVLANPFVICFWRGVLVSFFNDLSAVVLGIFLEGVFPFGTCFKLKSAVVVGYFPVLFETASACLTLRFFSSSCCSL